MSTFHLLPLPEHLSLNLVAFASAGLDFDFTHFSTLAWKIPWAEEPGRLQSMGSLRVGYD